MKLGVVSQYFWPETFLINDLVRHLAAAGHEVTVFTGKPNYPGGKVFSSYQAAGLQRERFFEAVDVFRVPIRLRGEGGARNLALNYLSFVWSGLRYFGRLAEGRELDAILVFAPSPITQAIPAILLKYRKRAHLAVWVQDLWPESLAATGYVRHWLPLWAMGQMVRVIYRFTDTLLLQSRAFEEPMSRFADPAKLEYYPNSIDAGAMAMAEDVNTLPADLIRTLETHFCVVFAGNIGNAQAVETIVDATRRLTDLRSCRIVLVGSGSRLDWVRDRRTALNLDNLVLAGRFPMEAMPGIYSRASGLLVTLRDEEIFSYTVPSKVQAYLAAGRPIIASLNGEGARVAAESGAGLTCPAEDGAALAECIRVLHGMTPAERRRMGESGRAYFDQEFDMRRQAGRLVRILQRRMADRGGAA